MPDQQGVELLEQFDNWAELRNKLREVAVRHSEWAGIPMPLFDRDLSLVMEPKYPLTEVIKVVEQVHHEEDGPPDDRIDPATLRNTFWSSRDRCWVHIQEQDGKIVWFRSGDFNHVALMLATLQASKAWGIEQERNAIDLLATLVRHHQFKQYLLTGMLLESSKRSGVFYLFRRLRPTIAMSFKGRPRVLCTLCMHPIGYYSDSWAGAMAPTDDVIAHLMLMRGDEHMFWRRCNQHPSWVKQSGI